MTVPIYSEIKPAAHLTKYIAAYWVSKGFYRDMLMFPVFADGCCDIIYDYTEQCVKMVSTGVSMAYVPLCGDVDMAGIRFRPGGFTALTGIPAAEIVDGIHLGHILRNDVSDKLTKLFEDRDFEAFNGVFSGFMNEISPFMGYWLSSEGAGIVDISEYFKCSEKTVNRVFLNNTGVSPVKMISVKRFRCALNMVLSGKMNMTEIACEAGYYDQSHFIRDFRKFAGTNPTDFLRYKDSLGVRFIQFPSGCL